MPTIKPTAKRNRQIHEDTANALDRFLTTLLPRKLKTK